MQRRDADVLQRCQVRKEVKSLEHQSHSRTQRAQRRRIGRSLWGQRQPGDFHRPGVEGGEPVEAAQERALPAARRPDHRNGLAARHFRVDSAEDLARPERLLQPAHADDHVAGATTGSSPAASSLASSRAASRASG